MASACERCWELDDLAQAARRLTIEESTFVTEHRRSCPLCGLERAVRRAAGSLDEPGPAAPLTAEAQAALLEAVLRGATADEVWNEAPRAQVVPLFRRRLMAGFALAASLALVGGLGWQLWPRESPQTAQPVASLAAPRLVLVSGDVSVADGGVHAGTPLAPGQLLTVVAGRAGLSLCGQTFVTIDANTKVRVSQHAPGLCQVVLDEGRLGVEVGVPPGTRFVVETPHATAEALGTAFVVEVSRTVTEVRVHHGVVKVSSRSGAPSRLAAMQGLTVGRVVEPLTPKQVEADREVLGLPVARSGSPAVLELHSDPEGADVTFDALALGKTPLSALVDPGPHALELRLAERTPVRQQVDLTTGGTSLQRIAIPARPAAPGPSRGPRAPAPVPPARDDVAPGGSGSGSDDSRSPSLSPRELIDLARTRRGAGDQLGALAAYEMLFADYPQSEEAQGSVVPFAQMLLARTGSERRALALFERYLAGTPGTLVEEAVWGRILALGRLGRTAEEAKSLREFLAQHPGSLNAPAARRRLEALGGQ